MIPFNRIIKGLDISKAAKELSINSHLFGEIGARKNASEVHSQMDDIWLRFGDIPKDGDYSKITNEHDSIWLKHLPECRNVCFKIMTAVDGERLGGVLITRLPAGGKILPHTDSGWHAEYYDKYYVPIKNKKGAVFCFDDGVIDPCLGDVWAFNNSYAHWVDNNSDQERIAMIACVKQSKYTKEGKLCLGQQQQ